MYIVCRGMTVCARCYIMFVYLNRSFLILFGEPCHVGQPLSSTSVQLSLSANRLGRLLKKAPESLRARVSGSTVDPRVCEHGCALVSSGTHFWEARTEHWKPQGTSEGSPASLGCSFHHGDNPLVRRKKVAVSRWCGHEQLNRGLQKPCDTSYYMLSEPWHVARPFSRTAVRQVPPSTVSVTDRKSTGEPFRAELSSPKVGLGVLEDGYTC